MQRPYHIGSVVLAVFVCHVGPGLAGQPAPFPRLHLVGSLGQAFGAGNRFTDIAVAGGIRIGRVETRLRLGGLAYLGGCDTIVPTKCAAGDGGYFDATAALRLGGSPAAVAGWTASAGMGVVRTGDRAFIAGAIGRDLAFGRRGLLRVEIHGRHLFDQYYRDTWGTHHRQVGVRVGVGLWSAVDRL
ncbi:MAG: hypothetical protein ACKVZ0_12415 [Gemmatimonadales bacterium]